MKSILNPALRLFVALSVITGLIYPLFVTSLAQIIFPAAANGSLQTRDGQTVGSRLIGQAFAQPGYFWGRPSATADAPYNGMASGGSNLSNGNPALRDAARARIAELQKSPVPAGPVPVDLVTASGSGLDPHISPAAAYYQLPRVAAARGLAPDSVKKLIAENSQTPAPRFIGEPRVNVLALNLALDALAGNPPTTPPAAANSPPAGK